MVGSFRVKVDVERGLGYKRLLLSTHASIF